VVYVLAAYTLTIGVLSIYGVLLQHRVRVARARIAFAPGASEGAGPDPGRDPGRGFNLGAALLAPLWAWAHGLRAAGAALVAALVALALAQANGMRLPALVLVSFLLGSALFFGVAGNRIARASAGPLDPAAFEARQLTWALVGVVLHTVVLPWAAYFGLAAA